MLQSLHGIFRHASVSSTYPCKLVGPSVRWLVRPSHFPISNLWSVTVDQIKKFKKQSPSIFEFCFWKDPPHPQKCIWRLKCSKMYIWHLAQEAWHSEAACDGWGCYGRDLSGLRGLRAVLQPSPCRIDRGERTVPRSEHIFAIFKVFWKPFFLYFL